MSQDTNPFERRTRRPGEWLIEKSIVAIASFSILVIFLILLFVLRESLPLFAVLSLGDETGQAAAPDAAPAREELRPDVYNPEVYNLGMRAPAAADPLPVGESSDTTPAREELRPDVYNPEVYDLGTPSNAKSAPGESIPGESIPGEVVDLREGGSDTVKRDPVAVVNLLGTTWQPVSEKPKYGMTTLLVGTLKTTLVAIAIGAPLGILAALYVAFFAGRWVREVVKPAIEILAGFPSVVVGLFCLMTVGTVVQNLFGLDFRLNAFVGGIGLSIAVIPIVFTITEDALSSVPRSLREASLALGATEWETAYRVMLPAAFPGVFAAVLLGVGRAFGETMIALMATGNAALLSWSVFDPVRTFAATIGAEMGEVVWGSTHYNVLFFLGVVLFLFSFSLNIATEVFVKERLMRKFQGK